MASAAAQFQPLISVEDYLEGERFSEIRHEYVGGRIYAMAGASKDHNRIALNILGELRERLRGKRCEPFGSDMKLKMPGSEVFYYPDALVTRDAADNAKYFCEKPAVVFEVLSPETERTDQGEKRLAYALIPSLKVFVLVAQDKPEVTVLRRVKTRPWRADVVTGVLRLPEIKVEIPLERMRLPTTVEATVRRFKDKPLEFEPGTRMKYSNSGYVLLGYIIEKVTGTTYEQFITEKIFQPLGMEHSGYDHPANILRNRASGYSRQGTNIVNCIPFAMDTPHAAGALYSTVRDMLLWDQALYSDRLISAKSLEPMFTENKGNYCYGWVHGKIGKTDRVGYQHGGGISGFSTQVIRLPKERVLSSSCPTLIGHVRQMSPTGCASYSFPPHCEPMCQ